MENEIPKSAYWKKSNFDFYYLHINGQSYFESLHQSLSNAQEQVFILGWDIDFRIQLIDREIKAPNPYKDQRCLGGLLSHMAHQNKNLKIFILIWDHPFFYGSDREMFSQIKAKYWFPDNIFFFRDDSHPFTGCHHQKLVVIDGKTAYVGGIDLTSGRWDQLDNPALSYGREDITVGKYPPFRDFMIQVSGDASAHFARHFIRRWKRGVSIFDRRIDSPKKMTQCQNCNSILYIARSSPRYKLYPQVKEVLKIHVELIKRAKELIYIENQYLTNSDIVSALIHQCKNNPNLQVTIILPSVLQGVFEKYSMERKLKKIIKKLNREDQRLNNLCLFYPMRKKEDGSFISVNVHGKIMIVDDCFLKVGSSNLNMRSMGLDTELDVVIQDGNADQLRSLKVKILASLLQSDETRIENELSECGNINSLLNKKYLNVSVRNLVFKASSEDTFLEELVQSLPMDESHPLEIEQLAEELFQQSRLKWFKKIILNVFIFLLLSGLTYLAVYYSRFLISYAPFSTEFLNNLIEHESSWLFGLGFFVFYIFAGLVFFPLNLFILVNATLFSPLGAIALSFLGAMLVGSLGFWIGQFLGLSYLLKRFPSKANKVLETVKKGGVIPIFLLRMIPLLPYSLTNFLLGAINYRFRHYFVGTTLGLLPGIIVFVVLQRTLLDLLFYPNAHNLILFFAIVVIVLFLFNSIKKRFL